MRTIAATTTAILAALMLAGMSAAETPLERGTYLMKSVAACPVCHTPWDEDGQIADKHFAGGLVFEEDEYTAYASNITPDVETGIGGWSDEEIVIGIREGKRPDGSIIGPAMPIALYRGMSDRDAQAIVAYLRSIPPIRNEVPASEYEIPLPADYGPPLGEVPEVAYYDLGAYGEYLAGPDRQLHSLPHPYRRRLAGLREHARRRRPRDGGPLGGDQWRAISRRTGIPASAAGTAARCARRSPRG